ncbi:uncharacterized protein LOC142640185 [Castanea sativa]|uniref:uncharacterized protein LOC142640185 n=1 Tax=Castanea sativa TaxID=21020 RepID=UPI003F654641
MEHELRKSLTMKLALSMRQLMDHIDKYKRVENDQIQERVKTKCSRRKWILEEEDIMTIVPNQAPPTGAQVDKGYTTKECRTLRDHLNQLVKAGKLDQFWYRPTGQYGHSGARFQKDGAHWLTLGNISVIFARPRSDLGACLGVLSVVGSPDS